VIGCGSIGLLAIFAACAQGAEVDAVDPVESRRLVALRLGAGRVFEEVAAVPDDSDVVIDAVGVEATWTAGLHLLRPGGTIVVVGLGQLSGSVPVGLMVRSGLSLRGSYGYGREHFEAAIKLLSESPPDVGWLTERPLDDAPNAFAELVDRPSDVLKVLLTPSL
jgi:threonine dehydrogenase-like Zn-dependent dehydrogenase